DRIDHLTTAFPEVRLKRFLEMRGADSGPWDRLCALPALWVGLLYDDDALNEAWALCKDWSEAEREALRRDVPRLGFKARIRGRTVGQLARDVLAIAQDGLRRRRRLDKGERDEARFLDILHEIADSGRTPAEEKLELFRGRWNGSVDPAYQEFAY
ncbi:MAG: glutamate-cysteine ligase family protein, partial [Dongiaceae bacterium]